MMMKKKLSLCELHREEAMKEGRQEEHILLLGKKKTINLEEPDKHQPSPKIGHKHKEEGKESILLQQIKESEPEDEELSPRQGSKGLQFNSLRVAVHSPEE